jgi:hypothetical protein
VNEGRRGEDDLAWMSVDGCSDEEVRTHLESSMEMIDGRRSVVYLSTQSSGDAYGAGSASAFVCAVGQVLVIVIDKGRR